MPAPLPGDPTPGAALLPALAAAVQRELDHQRELHRAHDALPAAARVEAGHSLPPLKVEAAERDGRRWRLTLRLAAGAGLPDGFSPGEPLWCGPWDQAGAAAPALLRELHARAVEVGLDGDPPPPGALVELRRRFDAGPLRAWMAALREPGDHPLAQALRGERPLGPAAPAPVPPGLPAALDPAAHQALAQALAADPVALIHGPPGTGKTFLLSHLLRLLVDRGEKPWALADSNAAADHLARAAVDRGLRPLRLGAAFKIGPAARHLSLDAALEAGPFAPALAALEREIKRGLGSGAGGLGPLFRERDRLRDQARAHAIEAADLLVMTFGALARRERELPPARWAVVDEATQATEPAVWIAARRAQRLVLVGDPEQLGPVVTSGDPLLARPLLTRLLAREDRPPMPMLEVQRRMAAPVQALVAPVYGPAYRPHPGVAGHRLVDLPGVRPGPLTEAAVVFMDTAGSGQDEALDPVSRSRYRDEEVEQLGAAVDALLAHGVPPAALGVIAAYRAQVQRLRARLPAAVEVSTVDGFQGREAEAVLVSFVRSNPDGALGFVADGRRLPWPSPARGACSGWSATAPPWASTRASRTSSRPWPPRGAGARSGTDGGRRRRVECPGRPDARPARPNHDAPRHLRRQAHHPRPPARRRARAGHARRGRRHPHPAGGLPLAGAGGCAGVCGVRAPACRA